MGSDDGGIRILHPEVEPWVQGFDSKAPGVRVSSLKEWTSLKKFVEVLGVAELVCIHNGYQSYRSSCCGETYGYTMFLKDKMELDLEGLYVKCR